MLQKHGGDFIMTHAWSRKIYRIAFKNCRFTEDAALCNIYLKRFFDF